MASLPEWRVVPDQKAPRKRAHAGEVKTCSSRSRSSRRRPVGARPRPARSTRAGRLRRSVGSRRRTATPARDGTACCGEATRDPAEPGHLGPHGDHADPRPRRDPRRARRPSDRWHPARASDSRISACRGVSCRAQAPAPVRADPHRRVAGQVELDAVAPSVCLGRDGAASRPAGPRRPRRPASGIQIWPTAMSLGKRDPVGRIDARGCSEVTVLVHDQGLHRRSCASSGAARDAKRGRAGAALLASTSSGTPEPPSRPGPSSAGCKPRDGPLTSTTPRVRPVHGSRERSRGAAPAGVGLDEVLGAWMCTASPRTRAVPIALVPTLASVQAEPPTKPSPSAIRRTPALPTCQSTRPSASVTTTSWPASTTERERLRSSRAPIGASPLGGTAPLELGCGQRRDLGRQPGSEPARRHPAPRGRDLGARRGRVRPLRTGPRPGVRCRPRSASSTTASFPLPAACNPLQPCPGVRSGGVCWLTQRRRRRRP